MDGGRDEWGELMVAAQAGHGGAYRRLLGELRTWLIRYYARRLPPGQIDDAVQDTLIAIHEKRHTYDPRVPSARGWRRSHATNGSTGCARWGASAPRRCPTTSPSAIAEEAVVGATVLRELMGTLKPAQADAIRLVKLEGYSIEEASARTGQSGSLVKVNIHRGLQKLAAIVQGRGDDE